VSDEQRAFHRPISITVEDARKMPDIRELPQTTQMTINIKGNRAAGLLIVKEIIMQILTDDFFAVEITGPS
jgi:hypothetical protein